MVSRRRNYPVGTTTFLFEKLKSFKTFFSIIFILSFLVSNISAEDESPQKETLLRAKCFVSLGVPYGIPGFHLEFGRPNLSFIVGVGHVRRLVPEGAKIETTDYSIFFGAGGTFFPLMSRLRPRVLLLYATISDYLLYFAQNDSRLLPNGEELWDIYHEENFPGISALLNFEIRITKNAYLEIGIGINQPFKGWPAIDELERDAKRRIDQSWDFHPATCLGRQVRYSFQLGASFEFWKNDR